MLLERFPEKGAYVRLLVHLDAQGALLRRMPRTSTGRPSVQEPTHVAIS